MSGKSGSCIECGGTLCAKLVQKVFTRKGRLIAVISDIPADVCEQCGAKSFKIAVVKKLETQLSGMNRSARKVEVPFAEYAA